MVSKKLGLNLALFCLVLCVNAEQEIPSNKSDLTQDKFVQEQDKKQVVNSPNYDFSHVANCLKSVCDCKIHHDCTDQDNLGLIEALCELHKYGGFNSDDILGKGNVEKGCGCTITCENCGCREISLCLGHFLWLEYVVESKLQLIGENNKNKTICDEYKDVESGSKELESGVVAHEVSKLDSNQIDEYDCKTEKYDVSSNVESVKDCKPKTSYFDWSKVGMEPICLNDVDASDI